MMKGSLELKTNRISLPPLPKLKIPISGFTK